MDMLDELGCRCGKGAVGSFGGADARDHFPPDLVLEPIDLDVSLDLNMAEQTCDVGLITTVRARQTGTQVLTLHGVDFLDVTCPTDGVQCRYDGRVITCQFDDDFQSDEERAFTLNYRVAQPQTGLYFATVNGSVLAATDNESERARHWLACVDLPSVRPTLSFHITTESHLTVLAPGTLQGEDLAGPRKTAHWRLDEPCPSYLTCFAVGDFVRVDHGEVKGVPLASFASRAFSADDVERSFGATADIMKWMTTRLDHPFPYPKYYQVALPAIGGAMENITLTTWDDRFVCDASVHREFKRLVDSINVHEMAHSYFGDLVVCRDFAHAWLKESWATFMQQCYAHECLGDDEGALEVYDQLTRYAGEADGSYMRPIVTRHFAQSFQMYDMHLYPGGACRLRMLRAELGHDVFWGGVKQYLTTFAGRTVETADFRRTLEEHSGRSLVAFFDQWFYAKGYPRLKVTFSYDAKEKTGAFTIKQTQVDTKNDIRAFTFDLDVSWACGGDASATRLRVSQENETFQVPMHAAPTALRIDPDHVLVHRLEFNPGEAILDAQMRGAEDIIGRIQAGEELARKGRARNIRSLQGAYAAEPFWGVRKYWALAMGKVTSQAAVDCLAAWIRDEEDVRVMQPLFDAGAKLQDLAISDAIRARLAGDLPHYARRAALMALGQQRDPAAIEALVQAASEEGWGGFAQSGAFAGLAASRDPAAIQALTDRIEPGTTHDNCRNWAVEALGQAGQWQDKSTRRSLLDALVRRLRDPHHRVRLFAIRGLRALGETAALGPLESMRQSVSDQEAVEVQATLSALRKRAKPQHAKIREELEALQSLVRKMDDKLRAIERRD